MSVCGPQCGVGHSDMSVSEQYGSVFRTDEGLLVSCRLMSRDSFLSHPGPHHCHIVTLRMLAGISSGPHCLKTGGRR